MLHEKIRKMEVKSFNPFPDKAGKKNAEATLEIYTTSSTETFITLLTDFCKMG